MGVYVEMSMGEAFDRLVILEIKLHHLTDPEQLRNVQRDYVLMQGAVAFVRAAIEPELPKLVEQLKMVNEKLWHTENAIRRHERQRAFGPAFIELARSIYRVNDERSRLKREINRLLGSDLVEEKDYS